MARGACFAMQCPWQGIDSRVHAAALSALHATVQGIAGGSNAAVELVKCQAPTNLQAAQQTQPFLAWIMLQQLLHLDVGLPQDGFLTPLLAATTCPQGSECALLLGPCHWCWQLWCGA